jgi:hypothetical protein
VLAVAHDGWAGLATLRIVNYTADFPDWARGAGSMTRGLALIAWAIPVIAGLVIGAVLGERLYRHLVVEKLRWMTAEEVDEARRNEKQYF